MKSLLPLSDGMLTQAEEKALQTALQRIPQVCECCGLALPPSKRRNRPRRFCNSACRSKAYWDREEAAMVDALFELGAIEKTFDRLRHALSVRTSRKTISKRGA
jgi:hypothetical protein